MTEHCRLNHIPSVLTNRTEIGLGGRKKAKFIPPNNEGLNRENVQKIPGFMENKEV